MIFKRFILFVAVFVITACGNASKTDQVCIEQHCFEVELALTQPERSQGLMDRKQMAADTGMLFIFDAERPYSFWMKNTFIALDIIWMDYSRKIIHIERDVPPCEKDPCPSYQPSGNALYVLEVNAGTTKRLGINPGVQAEFHLPTINSR